MRSRQAVRILLGLVIAASTACGDKTAPAPTVAGVWDGGLEGQTVALTLGQTGTTVTGNGTISRSTGPLAVTVVGTYVTPDLSLTISAQGFQDFNYTARHEGEKLTGVANGSGYVQSSLMLLRRR